MRGVLQVTLLCFSWAPLLRRIAVLGAALTLAGHMGLLLFATGGPVFLEVVSVILSMAFIAVSVVLATGVMWRCISAPRTLRLVPYGRLKLLAGVLVAHLLLASLVAANVALFRLEAPATPQFPGSLASIFIGALAGASAVTLLFFLLSGTPYIAIAVTAVAWLGDELWSRLAVPFNLPARVGPLPLLAAATALAWSAFAAWYLRARRIAPPSWGSTRSGSARRIAEIHVSAPAAIGIQLIGPSPFARLRNAGLFIAAIVAVLLWGAADTPSSTRSVTTAMALSFFLLITSIFPFGITAGLAGRSRALWLRSGCSREQLFRVCERLGWRCLLVGASAVLLVLALAWVLVPHPTYACGRLLLEVVALEVCGLYVGLMSVRGANLRLILEVLTAVVGWSCLMVSLLATAATPAIQAIPIVLLLGALALRPIARLQWRELDWLICKPARLPSQALRPVL